LVDVLADPVDPFIAEAALGGVGALRRAAARLVHDSSFLGLVQAPDELGVGPDGRLFAGSDVSVSVARVHQIVGYSIANRRIVVGRLEWELAFELGTLQKAGVGRLQRTLPVRCGVTALVWLGEELAGAEAAAEVAHVLSVRVEAV
jgi:hypothetical protein